MPNNIILSICIPTYNRCNYLDRTIYSIVNNPVFSFGEIELVISDNASTDNTKAVVFDYIKKYRNIIYSSNIKNIEDRNFPFVISMANGIFCKLHNDTAVFIDNGLQKILNIIKKNIISKPVIFFQNGQRIKHELIYNYTADRFIRNVSFLSTWIGSFGIWKEDFIELKDIYDGTDLKLWQTNILYDLIIKKRKGIIYNTKLFYIQPVANKGSYNFFRIFSVVYLDILNKYLTSNSITKKTFLYIKKDLLYSYLIPNYCSLIFNHSKHYYDISDIENNIRVYYSSFEYKQMKYLALLYKIKFKYQDLLKSFI